MFGNVIVLKLASQLIQAVLAVVSAVTPHAAVYTPLSLTLLSVVYSSSKYSEKGNVHLGFWAVC